MYRIIGADDREYGPVSQEQLRQWIVEGRANADTRALAEGSTEWKRLGLFPEFAPMFAGAAPEPAAPVVRPAIAPVRQNNSFAVSGLVLAILSFCWCCCYGLPFNLVALVCSIIGLVQIRNDPQIYRGQGVAIAGLVLSLLSFVWHVGLVMLWDLSGGWNEFSRGLHGF
jgi:hypothetical protein